MKNTKVNTLVEGALAVALCSLFVVISFYVPILSLFASFVCGFPLMVVICRRGFAVGVASVIASCGVSFILTGNLISVLFITLMYILPAAAVGYVGYRNGSFLQYVFSASLFIIIGLVIQLMLINDGGNGINEQITVAVQESSGMVKALMSQAYDLSSVDVDGIMKDAIAKTIEMILIYMPSIVVIAAAVMGYVMSALGVFCLKRLRIKELSYTKFNMIRASHATLLVYFVSFLMGYIVKADSMLQYAFCNLELISMLMITVTGFSCVDYLLSKKIKSGYIRVLLYVGVFVIGFILVPILVDLFIFIGIFDVISRRYVPEKTGDDDGEK